MKTDYLAELDVRRALEDKKKLQNTEGYYADLSWD